MKKTINIEGYEVMIDAKIVDALEGNGLGPAEVCASLYLHTDLNGNTTAEIFNNYSMEIIVQTIEDAAMEELFLCGITKEKSDLVKKVIVFEKAFHVPEYIVRFYNDRVCSPFEAMAEAYLHATFKDKTKEQVCLLTEEGFWEAVKPWILAECDALGVDYGQI